MTRFRLPFALLLVALLAGAGAPLAAPAVAAPPAAIVDTFEAPLRSGTDGNGIPVGFFSAAGSGSTATFERSATPPAPVPGAPQPNNVLKMDFAAPNYGVVIHGFENDAANTWVSQDWSGYEGFALWVHGTNSNVDLFIDIIDNRNENSTRDDAERFAVSFKDNFSGWKYLEFPFSAFARKEIGNGAPNDGFTLTEVHGWAFGALSTGGQKTFYVDDVAVYGQAPPRPLVVSFTADAFAAREGQAATVAVKLSKAATEPVSVAYATGGGTATADRDYTPTSGTLTFAPGQTRQTFTVATLDDAKFEGDETVLLQLSNASGAGLGLPAQARVAVRENDAADPSLIDDFERQPFLFDGSRRTVFASVEIGPDSPRALPDQNGYERVLVAGAPGRAPIELSRRFALGENWSDSDGISFWIYGRNTGKQLTVQLLDNQAADPGPSGWELAWRDEFNGRAGLPPDPRNWTHEIGDGSVNGIPGWGNSELQYYTDSTENAALDGRGNLQITVRQPDEASAPTCYYGPCKYTSARLISWHKAEFAYGRFEARVRVPQGAGLWPAFWSLGTNIDRVGWPQTGEIDFMEYVGRDPNTIFGTIHGPGYSGGDSFGSTYDFGTGVYNDYHTYTVEWQPNLIVWYVDGIEYHRATPADVAPNQWVFDHPFFLLLNVAVGGNFGGPVGPDTTFPQSMAVDYVRVYGAADSAERFEASFADDFSGWRRVKVPFSDFVRSKQQPKNAPNDGLNLDSVWGYGFGAPGGYRGPLLIDQVRVKPACAELTVTTANDSGPGSLRQALESVCGGGTISFAPNLTGQTIALSSGELTVAKDITIDGTAAPGLTISGGNAQRVLVVNAGTTATVRGLTIADGYGWDLAGGVLNNGRLTLDRVTVRNNRVAGSTVEFWKGGGGIYSGENSALTLVNSTVRDNRADINDGGGIYAFFGSSVTIDRSTVSGNSAVNVGGGLRTLGDAELVNSTVSGNSAGGWHGGGIFHTDGEMSLLNVTVANNTSPAGAAGGAFVGTFGDTSPRLTLANSIVAGNSGAQCVVIDFGGGTPTLSSGGHNIAGDGSCALNGAGDQPNTDPRLGALTANGGPTLTHAPEAGSPAIDGADAALCPAVDQRGARRPHGAGCDVGAVEVGAAAP